MMAQPVPHQTTDKRRVKVYELRHNDWFDRGTGFCSASFVAIEEGQPKEPRVFVESEDQPDRLLLETKIVKDDGFQRQGETLIVWTENGVDMALSFQEADGCGLIWKFIDGVQQNFQSVMGVQDDGLSDDLAMEMPASIQLPPADIRSLHELDMAIRNLSQSPAGRDALAKTIMSEDYISKLIPLVEIAEDLESLPDLHRLCNIMKTILLLNDTSIIEHAVSDECVLGVVGALEYDPDFPTHKANHRQWLNNQGRYKEVVRIQDEQVRRKIHQTYRLQYLKDVVLARILDDPTFSVLNSLIFFNQVDIVQHLHNTPGFLRDLFAIFHDRNEQPLRKKEAVLFIQQCCAIAKNLQPPARQALYTHLLSQGLLPVINFGLRHFDVSVRVGATDILVSMIDHDPSLVRLTIYEQIQRDSAPLTDTLIDLLLVEVDLGIKSQISDALKVLLDPAPPGPPQEGRGEFMVGQARLRAAQDIEPQQNLFLTYFYEHSVVRLFKPLLDLEKRTEMKFNPQEDGIFSYLNDILCFYIRQHQHRSKFFVLTHNLAQRFVQLLACKEKHLQLVAIRFFRQLVVLQDEFYVKHMADKKVLGPILDVLLRTLPRDNLLCSACLELFMLINKENIKELIKHMVENYREKLMALSYMDTFNEILNRYDQTQGFTATVDPYVESEDELGRRPIHGNAGGLLGEHLAIDPAQEDYLNASDDEEDENADHAMGGVNGPSLTNGSTTSSKPLVEYNSDEDDEQDDNEDQTVAPGPAPTDPSSISSIADKDDSDSEASKENQAPSTPTSATSSPVAAAAAAAAAASATPPERLSEKRRREEDEDEDALGKLTQQHKRRNSSGSVASSNNSSSNLSAVSSNSKISGAVATTTAAALKKIKPAHQAMFTADHGSGGGGGGSPNSNGSSNGNHAQLTRQQQKKMAISISPSVRSAVAATAGKVQVVPASDGGGGGGGVDGRGGGGEAK